jgi:Protein of unknown function (DUF1360)
MRAYRFVLARRAHRMANHPLVQAEDNPWEVVVRLRRSAGGGSWGKLLDCFYCLSVWVAAPLAVLLDRSWCERALLWPSLSAGASLLE